MGLRSLIVKILVLVILNGFLDQRVWAAKTHYHDFVFEAAPYTRLCERKNILTVNGQYPGPTLYVNKGDTAYVRVYNKANANVTLHWHGVKQPRNPWSDGPEYITQCPIKPGSNFTYKIIFSTEEGTLWWHAHSDWTRATGEWWKEDINEVLEEALQHGGEPTISQAYTINGQPGDLYPCSKSGTFRLLVEKGKRYLLRVINAAMNDELFFSIARHSMTLVGKDGSYTKPLNTNYIMIGPGQTMDLLLEANQPPNLYYMASRAYAVGRGAFDNTTTTAILQYNESLIPTTSSPFFPSLPFYNDTQASLNFVEGLRSLANKDHPINVPLKVDKQIFMTVSVNTIRCANNGCQGPNGESLSSSLNNISFVTPSIDILQAYYNGANGVFGDDFPSKPPFDFNFTADDLPANLLMPKMATEVRILRYNSSVEIVFQGTNLVGGESHPMHLHGYSFYVVGRGVGNFDREKDPLGYNFVDPPLENTVSLPQNGWVAIRFLSNNPGVWFMHCHLERHLSWGMDTVFIVKNGRSPQARLQYPPSRMPPC